MSNIISIVHVLLSIAIIVLVLIQTSEGGMGSAFGDSAINHTKRGAEKAMMIATIVFVLLFSLTSLGNVALG